MGSPITTWEGAGAFFTYANSPGMMYLFLGLAVVLTVVAIAMGAKHETKAYKKLNGG